MERGDAAAVADLAAVARTPAGVGVALVLDDPRPRAGTPLALALAGEDGRVVAAEGAEAATAARRALERRGRRSSATR